MMIVRDNTVENPERPAGTFLNVAAAAVVRILTVFHLRI